MADKVTLELKVSKVTSELKANEDKWVHQVGHYEADKENEVHPVFQVNLAKASTDRKESQVHQVRPDQLVLSALQVLEATPAFVIKKSAEAALLTKSLKAIQLKQLQPTSFLRRLQT
jgi:hypothetical protein